jgi:hypothetical protein
MDYANHSNHANSANTNHANGSDSANTNSDIYVNVAINLDNMNGTDFYEFSFHKKDHKIMSKKMRSIFGKAIGTIFYSIDPVYGSSIIPVRFYFKKGKFRNVMHNAEHYYQSVKFSTEEGPGFIYGLIRR